MKIYLQFITENYNSNKTELYITYQKLKEFPKKYLPLPSTLQILDCSYNKLNSLPELPSTLQKLYCFNNKLECIIPEKFINQQDNKWLEDYYYPMIKSYNGQKKILQRDITQIIELQKIGLNPKIQIEYIDLIKQTDWS